MSAMKTSLEHLKHHIDYPVNKAELVAACNNMSDVPAPDRGWFNTTIPDGKYKNPEDVLNALLRKV